MLVAGPITNHILDLIRSQELFQAAEAIAGMGAETREDFFLWTLRNISMDAYYLLMFYVNDMRPLD